MDAVWVSPQRASDSDRDRVARVLWDGLMDGRLSYDTFVARLGVALRARDVDVLGRAVDDLRRPRRRLGLAALPVPSARRRADDRTAPPLTLPDRSAPMTLIGRGADCDVVIAHPGVSRHHAALVLFGGRRYVVDRGSTNGTFLDGRPVSGTARVRAGDELRVGPVTFRLVDAGDAARRGPGQRRPSRRSPDVPG